MAAGDHFHAAAAQGLELGEQRVFLGRRELVARRMGDHRHATGAGDPAHRIAQLGPAVRYEAGLAFGKVAAEHVAGVPADAGLHQETREVRARDQPRVAHIFQRAFVRAFDAHFGELFAHLAGARAAAVPRVDQAFHQIAAFGVEAQADDVHGLVREGDRDLHPGEVAHALRLRRGHGALLAADLVVVGQRPQLHAVGTCPRRQFLRRQRAVGSGGMAVQVGVDRGHRSILRSDPGSCLPPKAMRAAQATRGRRIKPTASPRRVPAGLQG